MASVLSILDGVSEQKIPDTKDKRYNVHPTKNNVLRD